LRFPTFERSERIERFERLERFELFKEVSMSEPLVLEIFSDFV